MVVHDPVITQIESLSNEVCRIQVGRRSIIRKTYGGRGRCNGFVLPRARGQVEKRLLEILALFAEPWADYLTIPHPRRFDSAMACLYMSDLGGVSLHCCRPATWPEPDAWRAVGQFWVALERHSDAIIAGISSHLWLEQGAIRRIAVDRRLIVPSSRPLDDSPSGPARGAAICLGDLGLSNMLACNGRLGLVDLEFAHVGYAGQDVGFLAAQLAARARFDPVGRATLLRCRQALLEGFAEAGGAISDALYWADRFSGYYEHPLYSGYSFGCA